MTQRYNRREFFQKSAVAGAALALGGFGYEGRAKATARPTLVKVSGTGVPTNIPAAVKKLLEPLGGMGAFVKKGSSVLLKPNIGFPTPPAQRATTSPVLVAAVAKEVLDAGAKRVIIADNPVRRPEACLEAVGVREAVADLGVHLFMITNEKFFVETPIPKGKVLRKADIFKEALSVDVHIALPVIKSHNATGFSGSLKGMMGLILDRESFHSVFDINQAIADLNTVLRPHLVIADGLQVMATDGPSGPGELITCNTFLAGTDPVAVDGAAVTLAPLYGRNIKPTQVKHLLCSEKMGIGRIATPSDEIVSINL